MIDKITLEQKLKYLIISESNNVFDINSVSLGIDYTDSTYSKIERYFVDVNFEYNLGIDSEVTLFAKDIVSISEKMGDVVSAYIIQPNGKITTKDKTHYRAQNPLIWDMKYTMDETHQFNIGYTIDLT